MHHSEFREWARVALGDTRQVYAREAKAPPYDPLVYMPDGAALRFREAAQSGVLICPVPGCSSPKLTTRGPNDRRHHFMHVKAPDDPTHRRRYRKLAAQRLLREWAIGQDQVVDVFKEGEVDGIWATVLVLSDGSKVALCYVDKKLGADVWEEYNYEFRSLDITVAWVFALRETYFALPNPAEPEVEERADLILDQPIYKRMRQKGSWPLLINVERQKLASVFKPGGGPAKRLGFAPPDLDRVQHVTVHGLAECRLCRYGVETPSINEHTLKMGWNNWRR